MDIEKQIEYWRRSSQEDFDVARELVAKGRFRHGLFFVHLAVEKALKAHVARVTADVPPKSHNLVRLAELAELCISDEMSMFLRRLNAYQLEGRYPEAFTRAPVSANSAEEIVSKATEMLEWLTQRL